MRITFVAVGWEQLGISLLSAICKSRGHQVHLAFSVSLFNDRSHLNIPSLSSIFEDRREVMAAIEKQKPDVLAFSVLSCNYQWMLGIARDAKALFPQMKTVFGGVHTSAVPERVLNQDCVDYVVIGEGDIAFPHILSAIERGETQKPIVNTRCKRADGTIIRGTQTGFIQDLDSLPIFDKSIWEDYMQLGDSYITMSARGCPYRCTFCFNNFFAKLPEERSGRYVRRRSVEHMMFELRQAKKRYKLRMIEFFDDVFTLDKKWLKEFLQQYKRDIDVPFQCFTHVKYIDDEIGRWMSEAGCFSAQIGVQSMDDTFKRVTTKRYEKTEDIEKTIRIMNKYKIKPKFDHMFGLPGEPMEAQETARKFYAETPPYSIQTYWTNFFPGTEMMQQALKLGVITPEQAERLNEGLDCDIYSNNNRSIDPQKLRDYKAYEIIFKLIPHLPRPLRRRLNPKFFRKLPVSLNSFLSLMIDIVLGLLKFSIDHILYAKYYIYHIHRSICMRLRVSVKPATIVIDKSLFKLFPGSPCSGMAAPSSVNGTHQEEFIVR